MTRLYPTSSTPRMFPYGLAAFEIRGDRLYPTSSTPTLFPYGLAAFEIR